MENSKLTNRLLDSTYVPNLSTPLIAAKTKEKKPCPVSFTTDPLEFAESDKFLGIKLRTLQRNFLIDLYSIDDKGYPNFDTGVFIAGMRGGKSVLASIIAAFQLHQLLAYENPAKHFNQMAGQRLTIQFIASSEAQAKETAYASFEGLIDCSYWFTEYIKWLKEREIIEARGVNSLYEKLTSRIEFYEKNIAIMSLNSNSSSLAGKTSPCCIFDELSRLTVAEGAVQGKTQGRTAQAIYNTVARAATSLLPFSKVVTITSPMYEDDYGMRLLYSCGKFVGGTQSGIVEALRRRYPGKVERMLGYHATTFELNPKYDAKGEEIPGGFGETDAFFVSAKIQDPEAYRRDFLAIPPSAISPFFEYPERIESCVYKNLAPHILFTDYEFDESVLVDFQVLTRSYIGKKVEILRSDKIHYDYYISCDQGEKKDAFVVAMGHAEEIAYDTKDAQGNDISLDRFKVKIDFIEDWVPDKNRRLTVSFPNVDDTIVTISENFNLKKVVYDQWNSVESIQRLFSKGILTEKTNQSENIKKYELFKTLMYSGLIELPENDKLIKELRQLNKLKGSRLDHPPEGSSDRADAVVRVVWEVYTEVIMNALQGGKIKPLMQEMPTLRSIATSYDVMNQNRYADQYGWSKPAGAVNPATVLFGKGYKPQGNVFPNFKK